MQLALTGSLKLTRTDALKLTGRLFQLRRDVNLVSNVLDVPDLFWEEGQASLRALYDAVREYMEIGTYFLWYDSISLLICMFSQAFASMF